MLNENGILKCDGERGCNARVTHIDKKGFAYCAEHGKERASWVPCRPMRQWELARLHNGQTIAWERYSQARFLQRYGGTDNASEVSA